MQTWQAIPNKKITITHSGTDYDVEPKNVAVRRWENGFPTATLIVNDELSDVYSNKSANDDMIVISQKEYSDGAWTLLFSGIIRERDPIMQPAPNGGLLQLECDGAGYGLGATVCGQEYGTDSGNPSLDSIKEVTNDIIDNWVEKVLGTATVSGHSYPTYIEDIAGTIRYLYSPYKWSYKTINDLCDYLQAIKGANAGPHWIVTPAGNFVLTTVGAHAAPAVTYWPTWWRTNQAGSILTEGEDFAEFKYQELGKEANYVLYGGIWRRPGSGDACENSSGQWGAEDMGGGVIPSFGDDNLLKVVGGFSLYTYCGGGAGGIGRIFWPSTENMHLNLSSVGKVGDPPVLNFYAMQKDVVNLVKCWVSTDSTHTFTHDFTADLAAANKWAHFSFPLGPCFNTKDETKEFVWETLIGAVDWTDINSVGFYFGISNLKYLYIDGLHMTGGPILRAARTAAAYTSTNTCRTKTITDDVAKDDSLKASDDTGALARMAYAELLRCQSTPIIGTFTTPIANDLMPGQLIHIHAKKKLGGTFGINKDFRVTQFTHNISNEGFSTSWTVTDDVTNAVARQANSDLNKVLAQVRPEWQDRQSSSIKGSILDIDVPILEKSY